MRLNFISWKCKNDSQLKAGSGEYDNLWHFNRRHFCCSLCPFLLSLVCVKNVKNSFRVVVVKINHKLFYFMLETLDRKCSCVVYCCSLAIFSSSSFFPQPTVSRRVMLLYHCGYITEKRISKLIFYDIFLLINFSASKNIYECIFQKDFHSFVQGCVDFPSIVGKWSMMSLWKNILNLWVILPRNYS